jgi:hypothetical protein
MHEGQFVFLMILLAPMAFWTLQAGISLNRAANRNAPWL